MNSSLFEPFREWTHSSSEEGLGKALWPGYVRGRQVVCGVKATTPQTGSVEIIGCLEPGQPEFTIELRSTEPSWLNIKQLTEPHAKAGELTSTRPI